MLSRRPRYVPKSIWYSDMIGRYVDRAYYWVRCHILRKHVPKMSTWPNCLWCGKRAS